MFAPLRDPSQDFKLLLEDPIVFSQGQVLQERLCIYVNRCVAYEKFPDWRVTGKCSRRRVHVTCSRNMSSCRYVATYRIKKNKLCPTVRLREWYGRTNKYAMLYYEWSGWRDRGNNPACQSQVIPFVEMFLRAGEVISNKEVLKVRLAIHEAPEVDLRTHNCPLRKKWM